MAILGTTRMGSSAVQANCAELVLIVIRRDEKGMPYQLDTRTAAGNHATVHWTCPGAPAKAHLAREVVWISFDLVEGEELRIEPKPRQPACFRWDSFEIDAAHPTVGTGPVMMVPRSALPISRVPDAMVVESMIPVANIARADTPDHARIAVSWSYNLVLESPRLTEPLLLDPVIIIVEDP